MIEDRDLFLALEKVESLLLFCNVTKVDGLLSVARRLSTWERYTLISHVQNYPKPSRCKEKLIELLKDV